MFALKNESERERKGADPWWHGCPLSPALLIGRRDTQHPWAWTEGPSLPHWETLLSWVSPLP